VDEDHVHVAGIVQLRSPELPHTDHHEGAAGLSGRLGQACLGDRRDLCDHVVDLGARQVPGRHAIRGSAAEAAKAGLWSVALDVRADLAPQVLEAPARHVGEETGLLRVGHQEVRRGAGETQQWRGVFHGDRIVEGLASNRRLADPGQGHPRHLRIGGSRQGAPERLRGAHRIGKLRSTSSGVT
jgi:hypothetical protein